MTQGGTMPYMQGDGFQAVSLPYDGNELSFVAVMPEQFGAFETAFSADQAKTIASSLSPVTVQLQLPKFTIKGASFSLKSALAAGGMTDAFDPAKSDFSGMAPSEKLFVSDVVHQAFVAVDEAGTEAAAATAVVLAGRGAPSKVVALTIDKPFLFFVRDNATGAILFLGRVLSV
jgi:serpin B